MTPQIPKSGSSARGFLPEDPPPTRGAVTADQRTESQRLCAFRSRDREQLEREVTRDEAIDGSPWPFPGAPGSRGLRLPAWVASSSTRKRRQRSMVTQTRLQTRNSQDQRQPGHRTEQRPEPRERGGASQLPAPAPPPIHVPVGLCVLISTMGHCPSFTGFWLTLYENAL